MANCGSVNNCALIHKNCTKKPLIWDQDELSSSSGSRDMRSSFVAVVKNHTVEKKKDYANLK